MWRAGCTAGAAIVGVIALLICAPPADAGILPITQGDSPIPPDEPVAIAWLERHLPPNVSGPLAIAYVEISDEPSGIGRVITYRAEIAGAPVFDAALRLHLDSAGHPRWLVVTDELLAAIRTWPQRHGEHAIGHLWEYAPVEEQATLTRGWSLCEDRLTPAFAITQASESRADVTIVDGANGGKLATHELGRRLTGRGLVFDPNPVIAAGNPDLRDGDDVDPWLTEVALRELDGSGLLQGTWAEVINPAGGAFSLALRFCFSSRNLHFEEVMAYYHITEASRYVRDLGFPGLLHGPQSVKVHATALGESWFSPTDRRIYLGDGGVDDGEDADVILHEFGHALYDAAVGGYGTGESAALSEGFADYFAATRTGDAGIGNWDAAHRAQGCYRDLAVLRRYPVDLCGNPHEDGLIWGGLLWRLRESLGPATADRLILAALYFQTPRCGMEAAAQGLLAVAGELDAAAGTLVIRKEVAEALAISGLGAREGQATLAIEASAGSLVLPCGFAFRGPGMPDGSWCDSVAIGGDGRLTFSNQASADAPLLAPLMVRAGDPRRYDALEVAWNGTLERLAIDLRFRSGAQVIRHTAAVITACGEIEIEWHGEGDLVSFPALAGWFPAGTAAPYQWIALPEEPDVCAPAGEGLAIDLSAGAFSLAGGLWKVSPEEFGDYRALLLRSPASEATSAVSSLHVYPAPARPESRVIFRAPAQGRYALRIISPDGRAAGETDLGTLDPGLYEYSLDQLLPQRGFSTGIYYFHLTGPRESQVGRILLLQ